MLGVVASVLAAPASDMHSTSLVATDNSETAYKPFDFAKECDCPVQKGPTLIFYNRVPRCGSTTMLHYIENASAVGEFNFFHYEHYGDTSLQPSNTTRHEILTQMVDAAGSESALFERHIHYLETDDVKLHRKPVYIQMLRDPAEHETSSFYFWRDCICRQEKEAEDGAGNLFTRDNWCKAYWHWKSDDMCKQTINTCWANMTECKRLYPDPAMGGTVEIDFLCGTRDECEELGLTEAKYQRALSNLRDNYMYVGILEHIRDSLELLQHILPNFFGHMDAPWWATQHLAPDGTPLNMTDEAIKNPSPSEATLAKMKDDPVMVAEFKLYQHSKEKFECQMRACDMKMHGASSKP